MFQKTMNYNVFISPSSLRVIPAHWLPFRVVSFQAYISPRFMANENAIRLLPQGILCSSLFPPEAADSINRRWKVTVTCNGGQSQSLWEKKKLSLRLCFMYSFWIIWKFFRKNFGKKFNLCLFVFYQNMRKEERRSFSFLNLKFFFIYSNLRRKEGE